MTKVKSKIDCCGSNFETDRVSFFGLVTLSLPMLLVVILLRLVSWPLKFLGDRFRTLDKNLSIIASANIKLIEKQSLLPDLRCTVAAKTVSFSSKLSQLLYNQFNLGLLLTCWVIVASGIIFGIGFIQHV